MNIEDLERERHATDLDALIALERAAVVPDAARRRQTLHRVLASLEVESVVGDAGLRDVAQEAAREGTASFGMHSLALKAAGLTLAAALAGFGLGRATADSSTVSEAAVATDPMMDDEADLVPITSRMIVVPPAVAQDAASHEEVSPRTVASPRPSPKKATPRKQPASPTAQVSADPLVRELALLRSAKQHLVAAELEAFRDRIEAHRREYPEGQLVEEREALVVIASCRETAQPERAEEFAARYPSSSHLASVRAACL